MNRLNKGKQGFTLIEIIAVLVILAIIAAVVASRVFSTDIYSLKSTADVIKTNIRFAQTRAMSTNQVWGISFNSTNTYFLFKNGSVANQVTLPGQDDVVVTLPSGATVTSGAIISFDLFGKPYTDAAATALQAADRAITVTYGGGSDNITITKNTGFIP
jgi:MSHA pilin protein MshC